MNDSDFKLGLTAILVALGLLCATFVAYWAIDAYMDSQYIKAGYTHKILPGDWRPQWVKEPPYSELTTEYPYEKED